LALLLNDYFEEISDFIPGESTEFFLMMDKIRLALVGLAKNAKDETVLANLAEELNRFRIWYSCDSEVICRNISDDIEEFHTLRDAIALARLEKLEHDKYTYDFSKCSDYTLDEYVMSFGDVIAAAEKEDEEEGYIEEFMETFDNYGAYEEYDDYDEYNMYKEHDEE
jgi:hypothetical protein